MSILLNINWSRPIVVVDRPIQINRHRVGISKRSSLIGEASSARNFAQPHGGCPRRIYSADGGPQRKWSPWSWPSSAPTTPARNSHVEQLIELLRSVMCAGMDNYARVSRHMKSPKVKTMRPILHQDVALSLHGEHATAMPFSLCIA
jgi:hypothetical protein